MALLNTDRDIFSIVFIPDSAVALKTVRFKKNKINGINCIETCNFNPSVKPGATYLGMTDNDPLNQMWNIWAYLWV